ncbi:MAG TPA: ParB N-terminal domain-containing protein [Candidatus Bathyarchaeia archaeon]|nr:ParB N-terminal domain-containing protein [Candidatus Bathyarchaeia archaeon]
MEAPSSLKGYSIAGARIPILIALMKASNLKPHEETVPEDLKRLVNALEENPVLRHPIIADRRTGIVLDGTHRLAAIKQLECNFIPSALVDYGDPQIAIERWFRLFSGSNVAKLENDLRRLNHREASREECEDGLSKRRWYATVERPLSRLAFPIRSPDPYEMVRDSHSIEITAREHDVGIAYQDKKNTETGGPGSLIMSTIRIEKKEVVETVEKGKLFPPKSTRHLVPSRPLGGGVPIDWLQVSDFSEAQSRYQKYIRSRKVKRLPEGSRVGSRRYLEEVFLFE